MNRIYQGRVIGVELLDAKADQPPINVCSKKEGEQLLWDFHVLFQDAVNYYSVCLMAMASGQKNPVTKIRRYVDGPDTAHNVWQPFSRKGQKRPGMREVAKYFGLNPETASLEDCCRKALEGNDSPEELLDLALLELLDESSSGDVRNTGKEMFPRFCSPKYSASYSSDKKLKQQAKSNLSIWLYDDGLSAAEILNRLRFEFFANVNSEQEPKRGDEAKNILLQALEFLGAQKKLPKPAISQLKDKIDSIEEVEFPSYTGGSINKVPLKLKFYTYLLLTHVEASKELFTVLRGVYPEPSKKKVGTSERNGEVDFLKFGDDPIKLSRKIKNQDGGCFVFKAFTAGNLFSCTGSDMEPEWRDFDMAAFVEALKVFHQIEQKETERQKEREKKQKILDYMLTGKGNLKSLQAEESFEPPPILKDDPRIDRLDAVLKEMGFVSDLKDGEYSEYGLQERTIRGFEQLAEKWKKLNISMLSESDARIQLKKVLTEIQVSEKETIGSVALFEKFMDPENWIIWQQSFEHMPEAWVKQQYAENPLSAYVQKNDIEEEIARLSEPISFTPADPVFSRRQYTLGDKNTFKVKGKYHHDPHGMGVIVSILVRQNEIWSKKRIRLLYSAPRFYRDQLRDDSSALDSMTWIQPMMEALGEKFWFQQDVHNVPVFLMPERKSDGRIVHYLNFPATLDETAMVASIGKSERWAGQFAGGKERNIYLRWPADEWAKGGKNGRWYESREPFRVLSIDLGVRHAGAMSLLECRPDMKFINTQGKARHCRMIGQAGGASWYASVEKCGLLRLPGEDAQVFRDGKLLEEFYGEKGRLATTVETIEAVAIAEALGYPGLMIDEKEGRNRFYAYQNQRLLSALRWAQKRLRQWQGNSWMYSTDERREKAVESLREDEYIPSVLKDAINQDKRAVVSELLAQAIEGLKAVLIDNLVKIANRVVPLRGRNWEWVRNPDENGYILRQGFRGTDPVKKRIAGQRGLSIERIELIEELRKRCQSLNKSLQHMPGQKARLGYSTRGTESADPCPDILEKLEHLREQRVNQTAHLILAEALGVRLKPHAKTETERCKRNIHGEYEKIREPVDFIVLEDLNRYLTSQDRSRRENSRLMKWCHRAILEKLKQLCETYGIFVLEVSASYSSRFSAKDGTPGFRAQEVTQEDMKHYPWKQMIESNDENARKIMSRLADISAGQNPSKPRKLLVPIAGGPVFVPMSGTPVQADINAAINLGLRAVSAPEMLDIHHKIRTERVDQQTLKPLMKSNREKVRWGSKSQVLFRFGDSVKLERNSNCYPLIHFSTSFEQCEVEGYPYSFATGKALWSVVKKTQWQRVHQINEEMINKNGWEDNLPM